jgi:hypothetical protein
MTSNNGAALGTAGGGARPDGRIEPDRIPAAMLADRAPVEMRAPTGVPPSGQWAFSRPTETAIGLLVVCPSCCQGWCRLLPDPTDPYDYVLDLANGCSHGCEVEEVAWWHLWRAGLLPPREPLLADEQIRRRAAGIIRRILTDLPEQPSERQLTGAAYQSGRWLERGELPAELVADPLLAAAARAGLDLAIVALKLAAALTAGRAHPGRLPR